MHTIKRGEVFMKKSVKKVMKTTAILLLALIFAGSPAISPITSKTTIEAEASAKSDKVVKNARKCYYSTRKNLRRYKKVRKHRCTRGTNKIK